MVKFFEKYKIKSQSTTHASSTFNVINYTFKEMQNVTQRLVKAKYRFVFHLTEQKWPLKTIFITKENKQFLPVWSFVLVLNFRGETQVDIFTLHGVHHENRTKLNLSG